MPRLPTLQRTALSAQRCSIFGAPLLPVEHGGRLIIAASNDLWVP